MSDDAIQLRDQVGVLRRRWRVVAAVVAAAVGLGLLFSLLQTPVYVASTVVELAPEPDSDSTSLTAEQVATEARTATSYEILTEVIDNLGLKESEADLLETVTVEPDESGAAVLTISTTRDNGDEAAAIANEVADSYSGLSEARDNERLAVIEEQVSNLNGEIAELNSDIDEASPSETLTRLRSDLRQSLAERQQLIDAGADVAATDEIVTVLRPAFAPEGPSSPQPVRNVALAGVIGLLLGVGAAYLRDYFDDVVRDERGLQSSLPGLPVLGRIPRWSRSAAQQPTTLRYPRGRASEAYRATGVNVRTLLDGWQPDRQRPTRGRVVGRVLLVASATPSEGKTSTAVNLAVVAAQAGLRVVLIDADLRRPRVGAVFELDHEQGLADVLAGTATVRQGLADVGLENLLVLPGGNVSAPAAELLASPQRARLLEHLAGEADLVVIDGAAVLGVADALEMARDADLTVLSVREGVSRGGRMTAALQRLEQVGTKVAGIVVTDARRRGA